MRVKSGNVPPAVLANVKGPTVKVVGPEFMAASPMDLVITKKLMTLREGSFDVTDRNGDVVLTVQGSVFNICPTRVLQDAAGLPIVTLRRPIFSVFEAYSGNSFDPKDLLFTVRKSSFDLNVYLPLNNNLQKPNFKISGHKIYTGDSCTVLAEINEKHGGLCSVIGKNTYAITVNPDIDYAFMVLLFIAFYEIEEGNRYRSSSNFFKNVMMRGATSHHF